jgi:hypothetical protein
MARRWTRVIVMWPRVIGHVFMEGMALQGECAFAPPPVDQPASDKALPDKALRKDQAAVLDSDGSTAPLRTTPHGS